MLRALYLPHVLLALSCLSCLAVAASGDALAAPWQTGPFVAEAGAVARAAAAIEAPGADVVMLWREDEYSFDGAGGLTHRRRWVYRILTPAGLDAWSVSGADWSPWHQERPEIRVRVIDRRGGERRLDPAAFSELSAAEAGLEGERRLLRAPLRASVGAVVEEEVVTRDTRPLFAAGLSAWHLLVMPVPVLASRLVLEAPSSLPLRFGVLGTADLEPRRETDGDREILTFETGQMPAAGPAEAGLPADQPRFPHLTFSTGESWQSVAEAYAETVERRIAESDAVAVRRWLPDRGLETELERIEELLDGVRGNVRPEPGSLGSRDLDPRAPLATLRRGTGDGQDLATLLTAALRTEGIPAWVALVRAGYDMDVEPDLPGLGRFDRALIFVSSAEPVWIDPVDQFSRVGELASGLQGRRVLVARPGTRGLVSTPVSRSADNRTEMTIEVFMAAAEGPARIVETSIYHGAAEQRQRRVTSQVSAADRRRGYEAYVESAYRAEALGELEESDARDLSSPYRLRLEALSAGRAWTRGDEAAVAIDLRNLITALPRELLIAGGPQRTGDFVFHEPFVVEWHYQIEPPPKMSIRELPEDLTRLLGTGSLTRTMRREGSVVLADFRLDTGPRRLTPWQFLVYRQAVQEVLRAEALVLWFER
ncbi:MAG: DUF3857 and transglutaminase domain-containing protein [bacterium]|nr:DUF3857 and transglutaminase domain-containing protein [bacterium]